jgi:phage terminase large subunit-like protein
LPGEPFLTRGPQVARFFETYYRHTKGPRAGQRFTIEGWQQAFFNEWYKTWPDGERVYRIGLLGIPRGNGKSPITSGMGVEALVTTYDSPDVFVASGSKEQAGILQEFGSTFVELGPLSAYVKVNANTLSCPQRRGTMQVLSSDGSLQHGRSVSASLIDELHVFRTRKQLELHEALRSALHKRWNAWELNITTAGDTLDSILGDMYLAGLEAPDVEQHLDGCLTVARDTDAKFLMVWYGAPEGSSCDDPEVLRKVNPLSTVSPRDLLLQLKSPGFSEASFRRLHMNQFTKVKTAWIDSVRWASLPRCPAVPPPSSVPVYLGVDVAQHEDTTAVTWAWRDPDNPRRINHGAHVWTARRDLYKDGQAHEFVEGGKVSQSRDIRPFIRALRHERQWYIAEIVYDPAMFGESADILEDEGFEIAPLSQQSGLMAEAYSGWYSGVNSGETAHPGDKVFTSHVLNADAQMTERGWKVSKRNPKSSKIDALVSGAMARSRCARAERSVYNERGLLKFTNGGS